MNEPTTLNDDIDELIKAEEEKKNDKRNAYMRQYMKSKYHDDKQFSQKYTNSIKTKNRLNISDAEWKLYGIHLADVVNLRKLFAKLPKDIVKQVYDNYEFS